MRGGDIGALTDSDEMPVVHCARLLCSKFLLTGHPHGLIPDRTARVSTKALALGCLAAIVAVCPRVLAINMHINTHTHSKCHNSSSAPKHNINHFYVIIYSDDEMMYFGLNNISLMTYETILSAFIYI
jgi:hypothetical protein